MNRREFLTSTAITSAALLMEGNNLLARAGGAPDPPNTIRGVNLGGWLVLEKWMVPGVYRDTGAPDEYELCRALGSEARARLTEHRENFIKAEDFRWIKDHGLNTVRLPVGYWALEAPPPFVAAQRFVDFAFDQSRQNGLQVLLDLHGAPGSQNGWDHSGRSGKIGWNTDPDNIRKTVDVLEAFAERYGKHPSLSGIELLNEPRDVIPIETLQSFYVEAYSRIRKHAGPRVAVVIHDSFRPFAWKDFMTGPDFANVLLDTHIYQCFSDEDKARTIQQHIALALDREKQLARMQKEELPTVVGEWSLGLPGRAFRDLSSFQIELAKRAYADAQLMSYETARGWIYWSYKLQNPSDWSFRDCIQHGWFPARFPG